MNTLKKLLSVLLVLAMVFAFAACGSEEPAAEDEGTEAPHYICVTEPTFPPFDTTDENGEFDGFDKDLMDAIAADQGFTVEYVCLEFDALIPALESGQGDIITAGMNSLVPERAEKVDFCTPYYDSGLILMVKKDSGINGIDDLTPDMSVASQIGTTGGDLTQQLYDEGKIKEAVVLGQYTTCALQLESGAVDAVWVDYAVGGEFLKAYEDFALVGEAQNHEAYAFAVQKGNEELYNQINTGMQNLKDSGKFDEIYSKWFD